MRNKNMPQSMHGWLLQKPVPEMGQIQKGSRQSPLAAAGVGLDQRVNKKKIFICFMKPQPLHLKGSREPPGTKRCSRSDGISRDVCRISQVPQEHSIIIFFRVHHLYQPSQSLTEKFCWRSTECGRWEHDLISSPFPVKRLPLLQTKLKFPEGNEINGSLWDFPSLLPMKETVFRSVLKKHDLLQQ